MPSEDNKARLKVSFALHNKLKERAKRDGRTLEWMVEQLLNAALKVKAAK